MKVLDNLIEHYEREVEYYSDSWLERWHLNKEFKVINRILNKIIKKGVNKDALDIACHTGRYSFALSKKGLNVLAIDTSYKALKVAKNIRKKLGIKNIRFKRADATKLKERKKFDIIILMELLHHLPNDIAIKLLKQAIMLLKPGGFIIFDLKK